MTVQAPQFPVSQPMCVPVRSRSSRRKWTSRRRASTSRSWRSPLTSTEIRWLLTGSITRPPPADGAHGDDLGEVLRYSAEACTSDGGSIPAPRTASRTAFSSGAEVKTTGVAATQPSATRASPSSIVAAALTMQVPSLPIGIEAKPSPAPAGTEIEVRSSPVATAVM